jgi:hypothetical protein
VPHDALVFFVEGVHRPPGEGDPVAQDGRVVREAGVLPCGPRRLRVADTDAEPRRWPEVAVRRRARLRHEDTLADVVQGKVRDWVAARLVEEDDVLAVDHPLPAEPYAHSPAEGLGEQQPFR